MSTDGRPSSPPPCTGLVFHTNPLTLVKLLETLPALYAVSFPLIREPLLRLAHAGVEPLYRNHVASKVCPVLRVPLSILNTSLQLSKPCYRVRKIVETLAGHVEEAKSFDNLPMDILEHAGPFVSEDLILLTKVLYSLLCSSVVLIAL